MKNKTTFLYLLFLLNTSSLLSQINTAKNFKSNYLVFTSGEINLPLNQFQTTNHKIVIPKNTGIITDLNIKVNITHSFLEGIKIYISNKDTSQVFLCNYWGSGANYTNTVFDDESDNYVNTSLPPFTGSYKPETPLSIFKNCLADGDWTISVSNITNIDGQLLDWSLEMSIAPIPVNDVSIQSIDIPYLIETDQFPYITKAAIRNCGTNKQSCDVKLEIFNGNSSVFLDTQKIVGLDSFTNKNISFQPCNLLPGNYKFSVKVQSLSDTNKINDQQNVKTNVIRPKNAFYYINSPIGKGCGSVILPTGSTKFISSDNEYLYNGDWVDSMWIASSGNSDIYVIDTIDGEKKLIGNAYIPISGLAWDITTNVLYAASYNNSLKVTGLYTINLSDGSASRIGSGTISEEICSIAFDNNGNLFGISNSDDNLYRINKFNGTGVIVGSLGMNISSSNDLAYDRENKILFLPLFTEFQTTQGYLSIIDTVTGFAHKISNIDYTHGAFAIPYNVNNINTDYIKNISTRFPNFLVYPNPVSNILIIKNANKSSFKLFNIMGDLIINRKIYDDNFELNVSGIKNGSYVLLINNNLGSEFYRLIILK